MLRTTGNVVWFGLIRCFQLPTIEKITLLRHCPGTESGITPVPSNSLCADTADSTLRLYFAYSLGFPILSIVSFGLEIHLWRSNITHTMASRRIDPKGRESYSAVKYVQVEGLVSNNACPMPIDFDYFKNILLIRANGGRCRALKSLTAGIDENCETLPWRVCQWRDHRSRSTFGFGCRRPSRDHQLFRLSEKRRWIYQWWSVVWHVILNVTNI